MRGGEFLGKRWDITLEALAAGGLNGLRIVALILVFGLFSAVVDPDELLKLFRRFSYRSALTASLATRLVPVLARDAGRMGDAARCRPEPPGRFAVARAAVAGALDRAVDVAAALEVRGYSAAGRPQAHATPVVAPRRPAGGRSRGDRRGRHRGQDRGRRRVRALPARRAAGRRARRRRCARRWPGSRCCRSPAAARGWGWPMAEVVRAERFGYRYAGAEAASLREVSLSIEEGSFCVLAGVSGSGKSTLLRALCGLVPHFHGGDAAGELVVAGLSVRENGPGELARACGTVFQDPETQVVMGGVRAELALPLEQRGQAPGAVARAVEEVALALGIGHLLERRTETLSGGELQRVAIAAALVHRPRLLLLDEPTSQLDPVAGDELIWMLRRLNEEWGTAVVLAEHRLERCLPAADRVVALERGVVACDAAPREFLDWAVDAGGGAGDAGRAAVLRRPAASAAREREGGAGVVARRGAGARRGSRRR